MSFRKFWECTETPRSIANKTVQVLILIFATFVKAYSPSTSPTKILETVSNKLYSYTPWILIGLSLLAFILLCLDWCRPSIKKMQEIQWLLTEFREHLFKGIDGSSDVSERVTLFQRKWSWRLFSFDSLVVVARSGDHKENSRKCFRASQDGKGDNGVCGTAWSKGKPVYVNKLPSYPRHKSKEKNFIEQYASSSYSDTKTIQKCIKQNRQGDLPGAIYAHPIKMENGSNKWGVIVIDSKLKDLPINQESELSAAVCEKSFFSLEKILKRAIKEL